MTNRLLNIKDLMDKPFEDHDMELQKVIRDNPKYIEAEKTFEGLLEKVKQFDREIWFDLDNEANFLETLAIDTAFNEGFKLAIKLIFSSIQ